MGRHVCIFSDFASISIMLTVYSYECAYFGATTWRTIDGVSFHNPLNFLPQIFFTFPFLMPCILLVVLRV